MKKFLITAVITSLIGGAALAQTNVVSSANVVGYNQITIPSNQYVLVSLGFDVADNTISNLFGSLPVGSSAYLWDTQTQAYKSFTKATRGGWNAFGTNRITAGTGAFAKLPANIATNIYFSGDVPTAGTSIIYQVNGYALVAYPYPVDMAFTNTTLAKNSSIGDSISIWSNGWTVYTKATRGGWGAGSNAVLKVGQAFFYKSTNTASRGEIKPYTIN